MRSSFTLLVLSLAGAVVALESTYTGPLFNPSEAPYFAYSSLVIPTQTTLPAIQFTEAFSAATTISGVILPSTLSRSSAALSSASRASSSLSSRSSPTSSSASRSASSATSSAATSASASASASAPAQQSSAAAVANRAGVVGAVAGGLLAGLALA